MNWMLLPLRRYLEVSGRSRRKEYWLFVLFTVLVSIALSLVDRAIGSDFGTDAGSFSGNGLLSGLFSLATIVPSFTVAIRRLHDTDRSGWWLLLVLLPIIGWIALLVFYCLDGTRGPNRFGSDPKGENLSDVFA